MELWEGELEGWERQLWEKHLQECPQCQNQLAEWQQLQKMLQTLPYHQAPQKLLSNLKLAIPSPNVRYHKKLPSIFRRVSIAASFLFFALCLGILTVAVHSLRFDEDSPSFTVKEPSTHKSMAKTLSKSLSESPTPSDQKHSTPLGSRKQLDKKASAEKGKIPPKSNVGNASEEKAEERGGAKSITRVSPKEFGISDMQTKDMSPSFSSPQKNVSSKKGQIGSHAEQKQKDYKENHLLLRGKQGAAGIEKSVQQRARAKKKRERSKALLQKQAGNELDRGHKVLGKLHLLVVTYTSLNQAYKKIAAYLPKEAHILQQRLGKNEEAILQGQSTPPPYRCLLLVVEVPSSHLQTFVNKIQMSREMRILLPLDPLALVSSLTRHKKKVSIHLWIYLPLSW